MNLSAFGSRPEFHLSTEALSTQPDADVLAVPVMPGADGELVLALGSADGLGTDQDPLDSLKALGATGAVGEVHALAVAGDGAEGRSMRRLLGVGVGAGTGTDVRRACAGLARHIVGATPAGAQQSVRVATTLGRCGPDALENALIGLTLGGFGCRLTGQERPPPPAFVLCEQPKGSGAEFARAVAVSEAGWTARMLATVPSNIKNPPWMVEQARVLAETHDLKFQVWDAKQLVDGGFGGIVGVGQASATPPAMVRLDYTPSGRRGRKAPTVVLVGKGITFDSGGLSIKPGEAMSTMKRDMSGAGVVMATMQALAAVDCPVQVVGLIATAENAISGNALRPGDVITHYGGRTSEVTNTDAEGRLVMADALAYAADEIKPNAMLDVATLTGAVKIALGQQVGGLFASDEALASSLLAAGNASGEQLWRLPLHEGYREKLRSPVADADNAAGGAGAITAALFLEPFVDSIPWAHLDLASVGDVPEDLHEWTKGPSGFGSRVLLNWLSQAAPLAGVGAKVGNE